MGDYHTSLPTADPESCSRRRFSFIPVLSELTAQLTDPSRITHANRAAGHHARHHAHAPGRLLAPLALRPLELPARRPRLQQLDDRALADPNPRSRRQRIHRHARQHQLLPELPRPGPESLARQRLHTL